MITAIIHKKRQNGDADCQKWRQNLKNKCMATFYVEKETETPKNVGAEGFYQLITLRMEDENGKTVKDFSNEIDVEKLFREDDKEQLEAYISEVTDTPIADIAIREG
jgi:hypothetical protein